MTVTEATVGGLLALVVLVLGYRLLRREPLIRIVRLGVFIERQRFDPPVDDEQPDPDATQEWPRQDPPV